MSTLSFFFFQAEDGIRDVAVTGVQTCALPISLNVPIDGEITALRLDARGDDLVIGTSAGQLIRYDTRDRGTPRLADTVSIGRAPVTALTFLLGDRTLVIGDAMGAISSWQVVPPPTGGAAALARINDF